TTAIISPRQIDGTKCLSYQTIELHDEIDSEIKPHLHERAFGCDICQDVCPWNSSAKPHEIKELEASDDLLNLSAGDWYNMEKQTFKKVFKNSAVQRAGYKKLKMTLNTLQENQNDQQADS
ncbi:MAG TPA: 4Fe-4S double cluster binding domain-containing protein, partial [Bacteroidales bacterium]|nr:4Fe-4S double cluster binding domain-containing protein [Bacteroidales bacterium]